MDNQSQVCENSVKYDLAVAGGGFAGVAAAISASRNGLSVILIEKGNSLGGAASNCLVNPFMKYWTKTDGEKDLLSCGLFSEIINEMKKTDENAIANDNCMFNEEFLKLVLNRMVLKENISVLFNTTVIEAVKSGSRIEYLNVFNKSQKSSIYADYFIDATGDADIAAMSGVPYRIGRASDGLCQPMTLCFRLGNVDTDKYIKNRSKINEVYDEYKRLGYITNPRENVLVFRTMNKGVLHFNTTRIVKLNPVDGSDVSKAEILAREQVFEIYNMLKKEIPGFENCEILMTASQIGVRESRMIDGLHILTEEELKNCTVFEDSVAVGNYDIDIHNPAGSGTSHYYFPDGTYYTIPYRSLVPKSGADNLLAAGRCISATHEAQASIRIMPICCCLGEAAGLAACVAKNAGIKSFCNMDIDKLHAMLDKASARYN